MDYEELKENLFSSFEKILSEKGRVTEEEAEEIICREAERYFGKPRKWIKESGVDRVLWWIFVTPFYQAWWVSTYPKTRQNSAGVNGRERIPQLQKRASFISFYSKCPSSVRQSTAEVNGKDRSGMYGIERERVEERWKEYLPELQKRASFIYF